MYKIARKPSADPQQEKLRQNKTTWNKDVSVFVNDLISFKKMMNGWPSKFFKERSRITQPVPADPSTIIGSLANDFQELAQRSNSIILEQANYSKNRRQKQPKQLNLPLGQPPKPAGSEATKPDSKQLPLPSIAYQTIDLVKLSSLFEEKCLLEKTGSNPITRFVTNMLTPQFGFGEAARIRKLRMTLLNASAKTYQELKRLQNEIVKSTSGSIASSYKIMGFVMNHWTIVTRMFNAINELKPGPITDVGGELESPIDAEDVSQQDQSMPLYKIERVKKIISDYGSFGKHFGNMSPPPLEELGNEINKIRLIPKESKISYITKSNLDQLYDKTISSLNQKLETNGSSLREIVNELIKKKSLPVISEPMVTPIKIDESSRQKDEPNDMILEAQVARRLRKIRHQILPGSTSGSRLEIYQFIESIKNDLDEVMNLLEKGLDKNQLNVTIFKVNRQILALRSMVRSLHFSERPQETPPMQLF